MTEQQAGWYNDPYGRFQQRYHDGSAWTEHVATGGEQQIDPLGASSVIPIATPPTAFAAGGKGTGVLKFLAAGGPDAHERPRPGVRASVAGLGGVALALGLLVAILGEDATRGEVLAVSLAIAAGAWAGRMFVEFTEVRAAAVGMVVVAIPMFAAAATVGDDASGTSWTGFVMAALFIAAWALPGFKGRNLLLGLGALTFIGALGSLAGSDGGDVLPAAVADSVGDEGLIYLVGGALYLGITWWLDQRGQRGTATAFAAAGLVSTLGGTAMLISEFGTKSAPVFVLAVGLVVAIVGSRGLRRATTWWGAAITAIAAVWFVAVQWEPDSANAIGGVLIVAGLALIAVPLLTAPLRAAFQAQRENR